MTLYQQIIETMKEQPLKFSEISDRVKAKPSSLKSAVRDLHKSGYLSTTGTNRRYTYALTAKAKDFRKLSNVEIARKIKPAPVTTTQYAQRMVPNSVWALGAQA